MYKSILKLQKTCEETSEIFSSFLRLPYVSIPFGFCLVKSLGYTWKPHREKLRN